MMASPISSASTPRRGSSRCKEAWTATSSRRRASSCSRRRSSSTDAVDATGDGKPDLIVVRLPALGPVQQLAILTQSKVTATVLVYALARAREAALAPNALARSVARREGRGAQPGPAGRVPGPDRVREGGPRRDAWEARPPPLVRRRGDRARRRSAGASGPSRCGRCARRTAPTRSSTGDEARLIGLRSEEGRAPFHGRPGLSVRGRQAANARAPSTP